MGWVVVSLVGELNHWYGLSNGKNRVLTSGPQLRYRYGTRSLPCHPDRSVSLRPEERNLYVRLVEDEERRGVSGWRVGGMGYIQLGMDELAERVVWGSTF